MMVRKDLGNVAVRVLEILDSCITPVIWSPLLHPLSVYREGKAMANAMAKATAKAIAGTTKCNNMEEARISLRLSAEVPFGEE
jgi:hypothetical protein